MTFWLAALVDSESGDVPNLGANDGARSMPLTSTDYRDYRPSVILASTVFLHAIPRVLLNNSPACFDILMWLDMRKPEKDFTLWCYQNLDRSGFIVFSTSKAEAITRYPRFKF